MRYRRDLSGAIRVPGCERGPHLLGDLHVISVQRSRRASGGLRAGVAAHVVGGVVVEEVEQEAVDRVAVRVREVCHRIGLRLNLVAW